MTEINVSRRFFEMTVRMKNGYSDWDNFKDEVFHPFIYRHTSYDGGLSISVNDANFTIVQLDRLMTFAKENDNCRSIDGDFCEEDAMGLRDVIRRGGPFIGTIDFRPFNSDYENEADLKVSLYFFNRNSLDSFSELLLNRVANNSSFRIL